MTIESQLNLDSEILVENPELILNLVELMNVTPKRTLADIFAFYYLYFNKDLFIVYSFDEKESIKYGSKKSQQRWEQCMFHLDQFLGLASQALYAERYFDKEVQDSAKDFIKEVVRDLIEEVKKSFINDDAKLDAVEKLNTIQYVIEYPEEVLDVQKIEEFYKYLELNGTEGVVETFLAIQSYTWKIQYSPNSNSKDKLIELVYEELIKYYTDDNILCK